MERAPLTCPEFTYPTTHPSLNLYLAGKFADKERMETLANRLEVELGADITFRWWSYPQKPVDERTHQESQMLGTLETEGILKADLVIALMDDPEYLYRGTSTELGICIGSRTPAFVLQSTTKAHWSRNPFNHLATAYFTDLEKLIQQVKDLSPDQ